jgi:hypothetical protein
MLRRVKMPGGVFVFGRVAAPHVAANQTEAQVDPCIARPEAFFASIFVCTGNFDLIQMPAGFVHVLSFPDPSGE